MSHSWSPSHGVTRRLFIAALAALLMFTTVVVIPALNAPSNAAAKTFEYVLVFQNTQTVRGTVVGEVGNTSFVPDVGGTDPSSPDDGMYIHMSCSDSFNLSLDPGDDDYGYSQSGAEPSNPGDSGWRIADFAFRRVGTNGGQCGNSSLFDLGRIAVEKQTDPDGDQTGFVFTGDAAGTISDGQQILIENVEPGVYTSTEVVPDGWDLTSIVCDPGASGDLDTETATFTIVAGETLTCVFTNTLRPPPTTTTTTVPITTTTTTPEAPETPAIDIEKATNGEDADAAPGPSITVGEAVTWTYVVTNTGEIDLVGVVVTDDLLGGVCTIASLAIGASETCELMGVAVAGQYKNVGTATVGDTTLSDSDPSHYFGQEVAASATIGDFVWNDVDGDGIQDSGEKGIAGAKVRLTLPDGTTAEAVTNANGLYLFSGLEAGMYVAELILSSIPEPAEGSNKITTPSSFTIELPENESYLDADFGIVAALPNTGVSTDSLALVAFALLLTGTLAIFATRDQSGVITDDMAA